MQRLTLVRDDEWVAAALSCVYFFFVLCSYFLLRPLREAMGLAGGIDTLSWLFMGTLLVTLAANPLFGLVTTLFPRRVFVPVAYRFFMLNLVAFMLVLNLAPNWAGQRAGYVFYVWLSVFNLFAVSIFWAVMADGFTLEQGKRLFGMIAIGGTLGAIAGSSIVTVFSERLGPTGLICAAILLLEAAVWSFEAARRRFIFHEKKRKHENPAPTGTLGSLPVIARTPDLALPESERPLTKGGAFHGLWQVIQSPYLMGLCVYIGLMAVTSTFLYFAQMRIVEQTSSVIEQGESVINWRTKIFGRIDLITQIVTLAAQIMITGRLIKWLGVGVTLATVPIVTGLGFVLLGIIPSLAVITILQAANRAGRYAFIRPARETLFTVVSREAKYKAKSVIDTFVYRSGDVAGALTDGYLRGAGMVLGKSMLLAVPLALIWALFGLLLGWQQKRLAAADSLVEMNTAEGKNNWPKVGANEQ